MNQQSSQILSDPELDELLRSVKVRVPLPGTFQVEVWRRIAVSQEAALPVRISRWMDGFFNLLVRFLRREELPARNLEILYLFSPMPSFQERNQDNPLLCEISSE